MMEVNFVPPCYGLRRGVEGGGLVTCARVKATVLAVYGASDSRSGPRGGRFDESGRRSGRSDGRRRSNGGDGRLRRNKARDERGFFMEPEQPGPKRPFDRLKVWRNQRHVPSEEETRRLLGQVAQTGKPSEVMSVMRYAEACGVELDSRMYLGLLKCYINRGDLRGSARALWNMREADVPRVAEHYNFVIAALAKAGNAEDMARVRRMMENDGFEPDAYTFTVLIAGYGKAKLAEEAKNEFYRMKEVGLRPSAVTWGALITAYMQKLDLDKVLSTFEDMEADGIRPNHAIFSALVEARIAAGDMEGALGELDRMRERGLEPDGFTYASLMDALCARGSLPDALRVFQIMLENGIEPTMKNYIPILGMYAKEGNVQKAEALMEDVLLRGIDPGREIYERLVDTYVNAGDTGGAVSVIEEMQNKGITPDPVMYKSIIDQYNRDFIVKTVGISPADEIDMSFLHDSATLPDLTPPEPKFLPPLITETTGILDSEEIAMSDIKWADELQSTNFQPRGVFPPEAPAETKEWWEKEIVLDEESFAKFKQEDDEEFEEEDRLAFAMEDRSEEPGFLRGDEDEDYSLEISDEADDDDEDETFAGDDELADVLDFGVDDEDEDEDEDEGEDGEFVPLRTQRKDSASAVKTEDNDGNFWVEDDEEERTDELKHDLEKDDDNDDDEEYEGYVSKIWDEDDDLEEEEEDDDEEGAGSRSDWLSSMSREVLEDGDDDEDEDDEDEFNVLNRHVEEDEELDDEEIEGNDELEDEFAVLQAPPEEELGAGTEDSLGFSPEEKSEEDEEDGELVADQELCDDSDDQSRDASTASSGYELDKLLDLALSGDSDLTVQEEKVSGDSQADVFVDDDEELGREAGSTTEEVGNVAPGTVAANQTIENPRKSLGNSRGKGFGKESMLKKRKDTTSHSTDFLESFIRDELKVDSDDEEEFAAVLGHAHPAEDSAPAAPDAKTAQDGDELDQLDEEFMKALGFGSSVQDVRDENSSIVEEESADQELDVELLPVKAANNFVETPQENFNALDGRAVDRVLDELSGGLYDAEKKADDTEVQDLDFTDGDLEEFLKLSPEELEKAIMEDAGVDDKNSAPKRASFLEDITFTQDDPQKAEKDEAFHQQRISNHLSKAEIASLVKDDQNFSEGIDENKTSFKDEAEQKMIENFAEQFGWDDEGLDNVDDFITRVKASTNLSADETTDGLPNEYEDGLLEDETNSPAVESSSAVEPQATRADAESIAFDAEAADGGNGEHQN